MRQPEGEDEGASAGGQQTVRRRGGDRQTCHLQGNSCGFFRLTDTGDSSAAAEAEEGWRRDGPRVPDQQLQTVTCKMDKQQEPTG